MKIIFKMMKISTLVYERFLLSFLAVFIFTFTIQSIYRIAYPLNIIPPSVSIKTDYDNPKIKTLIYSATVYNSINKDVESILVFNRKDSDSYSYINLIPKTFNSDKITLKAKEDKIIEFTITLDTEDTRLITSNYYKFQSKTCQTIIEMAIFKQPSYTNILCFFTLFVSFS